MNYVFLDKYGNLIDEGDQFGGTVEAIEYGWLLAAEYQTKIMVSMVISNIERPRCDCGEPMERVDNTLVCPDCTTHADPAHEDERRLSLAMA